MASKDVLQSLKQLILAGSYQEAFLICKDSLRDNPAIFEYNLCVPHNNGYIERRMALQALQQVQASAVMVCAMQVRGEMRVRAETL